MKNVRRFKISLTENPPTNSPNPPEDGAAKAQYEMDLLRAESAKLKKQLEEVMRMIPSDEQRAKWAELEKQNESVEEARRRKEGEFDQWRAQIAEKHSRELEAERQLAMNARTQAEARDRELNDTLIGLSFSQATDWFGDKGKTVLLPAIAQAYFKDHVSVEVVEGPGGKTSRRVVVRDNNGAVIVDPRAGTPLPFEKAIGELIESHPNKNSILRGSGKVGSGSSGEGGEDSRINLSRLRPQDFDNANVRDAVRTQLEQQGGLQIGPGFDNFRRGRK